MDKKLTSLVGDVGKIPVYLNIVYVKLKMVQKHSLLQLKNGPL